MAIPDETRRSTVPANYVGEHFDNVAEPDPPPRRTVRAMSEAMADKPDPPTQTIPFVQDKTGTPDIVFSAAVGGQEDLSDGQTDEAAGPPAPPSWLERWNPILSPMPDATDSAGDEDQAPVGPVPENLEWLYVGQGELGSFTPLQSRLPYDPAMAAADTGSFTQTPSWPGYNPAWAAVDGGSLDPLDRSGRYEEIVAKIEDPDVARELINAPPAVIDALLNDEVSVDFALAADDPTSLSPEQLAEALEIQPGLQTPDEAARTERLIALVVGNDQPLVDPEAVRDTVLNSDGTEDIFAPLLPDLDWRQQQRMDSLTSSLGSEFWTEYIRDTDLSLRANGASYAEYTATMLGLGIVNSHALEAEGVLTWPDVASTLGFGASVVDPVAQGFTNAAPTLAPATAKAFAGLGLVLSGASIADEFSNGEFLNSPQDGAEAASFTFGVGSIVFGGPPGWILGGLSILAGGVSLLLEDEQPPQLDDPIHTVLRYQESLDSPVHSVNEGLFSEAEFRQASIELTEARLLERAPEHFSSGDIPPGYDRVKTEERYTRHSHEGPSRPVLVRTFVYEEVDVATGEAFTRTIEVNDDLRYASTSSWGPNGPPA